jgi:hypothetical protein
LAGVVTRRSQRWQATVATVASALAAAACSGSPVSTTASEPPPTVATSRPTGSPASTDADPATTAPATTGPATSAPATIGATTTTTPDPGSTSTIEPPPGVDEPARRRPASPLRRPTGFARFEPAPAFTEYAPLTGGTFEPAHADRAALAVKIDNAPGAQPQFNLADADLVIEENVEGVTRFVAVFHTNVPDRIGPVRSGRTSDLDILAGLNRPILAWSGGNPFVTGAIRGAHEYGRLADLSAGRSDCFWRSGLRRAPHNLLLDPVCAWESATLAGPAQPFVVHGYGGTDAEGEPTRRFTVPMAGITPSWRWDARSGRYLRSQRGGPHVDVDGERIGAENVLVLGVRYVTSDADPESPEAVTVGSGPATVHRDGRAIAATWSRPDRLDPYTLVDLDGNPIPLAPGTTWIELTRRRG